MDENQLLRYLKKLHSQEHVCLGVLAADELPKGLLLKKLGPPVKTVFFVANTKPRKHGGEHWVAVFIDVQRKTVEYYNSLGDPPKKEMLTFLRGLEKQNDGIPAKHQFQFKINRVAIQGVYYRKDGDPGGKILKDDLCGLYALSFIKRRLSGETFKVASGFSSHKQKIRHLKEFGSKLNVKV